MRVKLGARVVGSEGELGTVEGMVPNRELDRVEDLIVRHGTLLAQERQVPLSYVVSVDDDDVVHLGAEQVEVEQSKPFTEAGYRAPSVDWSAPPSAHGVLPLKGDFEVDATLARGAVGYDAGKPGGYPGDEQVVAEDQKLPVIRRGTPIVDISGEQVGEVSELAINVEDGSVVHLTMRSGLIFKHARELLPRAIRELAAEGIVLKIARGELDDATEAA